MLNCNAGILMQFQIREIQLRILHLDFMNVMFVFLNK